MYVFEHAILRLAYP